MNHKITYAQQSNKECAGKGCPETGIHLLRIRYLKKEGWFCASCKKILFEQGLIEDESGNEVIKK